MAEERKEPRRSPLVLLSFCLSLLAVALSLMALLMVNDLVTDERTPREALGVRRVEWKPRIGRIEDRLDNIRDLIARENPTEDDRQSLEQQLRSIHGELRSWLRAAEPHLHDAIEGIAAQADELQTALAGRSERAVEKLEALRTSLAELRKRTGPTEPGETPKAPDPE